MNQEITDPKGMLQTVLAQEEALQFEHFTAEDGWQLGLLLREHLLRHGGMALLHRALRDAVLARLRRRDPLAAALEGDARAALVAQRTGLGVREVRAALDTRPPRDKREFRERIARLIDLRTRL